MMVEYINNYHIVNMTVHIIIKTKQTNGKVKMLSICSFVFMCVKSELN